jgi:hypothetical protein
MPRPDPYRSDVEGPIDPRSSAPSLLLVLQKSRWSFMIGFPLF